MDSSVLQQKPYSKLVVLNKDMSCRQEVWSWRKSRQIRQRWYNLYVNHEKRKPSNSRNTQRIKCRTGCWKHTGSLQWGIFTGIRQDNRGKGGITSCPHKEKPASSALSRNRGLLSQHDATSRYAHTITPWNSLCSKLLLVWCTNALLLNWAMRSSESCQSRRMRS
jgi:hypothetical protein